MGGGRAAEFVLANEFSMASLSGFVRYELLYALQQKDQMTIQPLEGSGP